MKYLICYDITDSKRLSKLASALNQIGYRTQKSFFTCDITSEELLKLKNRILPILDLEEDKVAIYSICEKCYKHGIYIGCDMLDYFYEDYMIL